MFRVLIVDDEPLMRASIRHGIRWNEYDMDVAGEADSVQEAKEMILKSGPFDIVFTDIVMPGESGIELLKWLYETQPLITAAVLSYYDEFGYARKAMRFGAVDYIIKTALNTPDMDRSLKEIRDKANRQIKNGTDPAYRDNDGINEWAVAIKNLADDILTFAERDITQCTAHYTLGTDTGLLLYDTELDENEMLLMEKEYPPQCVLVSFCAKNIITADLITTAKMYFARDLFYDYLPNLRVYKTDTTKVLETKQRLVGEDYIRVEQELSTMQWIWDKEKMEKLLQEIRSAAIEPSAVYNLFYCVQTQWIQFFPQNDIPAMFPLRDIKYWYQWIDYLNNFSTFAATEKRLSRYSLEVINAIQDLLVWINGNFMRDIDLKKAAQRANLSPSYLSRCFRDIVGINFSDYIRHARINFAKRMLKQSCLPIARIAELCGFQDNFYFDRVFKKTTGETPGRWRQREENTKEI